VIDFTLFHSSAEIQLEGDELVCDTAIEMLPLSSVKQVSAKALNDFEIKAIDEESGATLQYQFRADSSVDRDRWLSGLGAHRREVARLMGEELPDDAPAAAASIASPLNSSEIHSEKVNCFFCGSIFI
jgi:hypothetical protein